MRKVTSGTVCSLCAGVIPIGQGHDCGRYVPGSLLPGPDHPSADKDADAELKRLREEMATARKFSTLRENMNLKTELTALRARIEDVEGMAKVIAIWFANEFPKAVWNDETQEYDRKVARAVSAWLKEG